MNLLRFWLSSILLISGYFLCEAQADRQDFSEIDSIVRTIKYRGDLKLLSHELTARYTSETEKARAIFIWVTDNIAYDIKSANNPKKFRPFTCKSGDNCDIKFSRWEEEFLDKVIRKKQAVCEGYSRLFKKLSDYAGLRTDVIQGYIKNEPHHIGKMGILDHAWNGILLDGKYYYLDATWAAGGCKKNENGKLVSFDKDFDNYYWLTPEDKFFRNHFPADNNHPYLKNDSRQKYLNAPYIDGAYMENIDVLEPSAGVVEVCPGDTIHFLIRFSPYLWQHVQINTNLKSNPDMWTSDGSFLGFDDNLMDKQKYIPFKSKEGYIYEFSYKVENSGLRYVDILFDYRRYLRFNVKMLR